MWIKMRVMDNPPGAALRVLLLRQCATQQRGALPGRRTESPWMLSDPPTAK